MAEEKKEMQEEKSKREKIPARLKREPTVEVTVSLLDVTEKFLKEGRRYFGKAAVGLQNQLDDPKYKEFKINSKLVNAGITGEKKTSEILREWIYDKDDCVLIDSISLPINTMEPEVDGEDGQLDLGDTDHLLIIADTLVLVDSKNWKTRASYKVQEDGSVLRTNKEFPGNRPRARQCEYLWKKFYAGFDYSSIENYICISSKDPFIVRDRNWWRAPYKLVNQETLTYFLDKLYDEQIQEKGYIRVDLVAKALSGLNKPYNKYKEKFGNLYKIANKDY